MKTKSNLVPPSHLVFMAWIAICLAGVSTQGVAQERACPFGPPLDGPVTAIAIDAEGRILIGGQFAQAGVAGAVHSHVARLSAQGSLDSTFSAAFNDTVSALVEQPDGRILCGGEFLLFGQPGDEVPRSSLARLQPDGSLDAAFDPAPNDEVYCLALQLDGKILVGGAFTRIAGQAQPYLARLNADGTLDPDFRVLLDDAVYCIALQPDARILVGGLFSMLAGQPRAHVGRLNEDGSLDGAFNPGANSIVNAFALQADGHILVGGGFDILGGEPRNRLGRLTPDGMLASDFEFGANEWVSAIALQADGKVLVAGAFTRLGELPRQHLGRFHPDGRLDTRFDFSINNAVYALAAATSGDVLFGGRFEDYLQQVNQSLPLDIFLSQTLPPEVELSWPCAGVLLQAGEPNGPWDPIPDATSPFILNANEGKKFYRWKDSRAVRREIWTGISGATVWDIPRHRPPDIVDWLEELESPPDYGDDYGVRLSTWITPPVTSDYVFWVAGDDYCELWLSTDESRAKARLIANVYGWTDYREWTKYDSQQSAPISLIAGRRYYVEALMKEQEGEDHLSVGWNRPGEVPTSPNEIVPFRVLSLPVRVGPVTIITPPQSLTVEENHQATFQVQAEVSGEPEAFISYRWQTRPANGTTYEDIPGATGSSYVLTARLDENGHLFRVIVSGPEDAVVVPSPSDPPAVLSVIQDLTPPRLVSAHGNDQFNQIIIQFDEPVDPSIASDSFNYTVTPAIDLFSAVMISPDTVKLMSIHPFLQPDTVYTVTVEKILDLNNNELREETILFRSFVFSPGFAKQELYLNIDGVLVQNLKDHPAFPNGPNSARYINLIEGPRDRYDNYGTRLSGWLVPQISGPYGFFLSSDDQGELWLSTDQGPDNLRLIAREPQWNTWRNYLGTERRDLLTPENRSESFFPDGIPLTAGQPYAFEALAKEGGGMDHISVAWQPPGDPMPTNGAAPIGGMLLGTYADPQGAGVIITQQPQDFSYSEGGTTTAAFSVGATGFIVTNPNHPTSIQWQRSDDNGQTWQAIPGANNPDYSLIVAAGDPDAWFRAFVSVPGATALSRSARLTTVNLERELIFNGSFENTAGTFVPDNYGVMSLPAGSTTIPGWTTTEAEIIWGRNGNIFGIATPYGMSGLDLSGTYDSVPFGGVTQTITTTLGKKHQFSLSLGSNADLLGANGRKEVRVTCGSASTNFWFQPTATTGNEWRAFSFDFTATSEQTEVTITGTDAGGNYLGLDNVSVVEVP